MTMTPEELRTYRIYENRLHRARREMRLLRARARRREGIVPPREYLGMGITAECDGEEVRLSTMRDYYEDEIYMEPGTLAVLVTFAKRCGL